MHQEHEKLTDPINSGSLYLSWASASVFLSTVLVPVHEERFRRAIWKGFILAGRYRHDVCSVMVPVYADYVPFEESRLVPFEHLL